MLNVHRRHWLIHLSQIESLEVLNFIKSAQYVALSVNVILGATISVLRKNLHFFFIIQPNIKHLTKKDHEFPIFYVFKLK